MLGGSHSGGVCSSSGGDRCVEHISGVTPEYVGSGVLVFLMIDQNYEYMYSIHSNDGDVEA